MKKVICHIVQDYVDNQIFRLATQILARREEGTSVSSPRSVSAGDVLVPVYGIQRSSGSVISAMITAVGDDGISRQCIPRISFTESSMMRSSIYYS
jgi:hypothetical protein